jgi:hypothetical protein
MYAVDAKKYRSIVYRRKERRGKGRKKERKRMSYASFAIIYSEMFNLS